MAPDVVDFNDRRAWDDSALVSSWESALAEYKRYHSIHQEGKRVEDVLSAEELAELTKELNDDLGADVDMDAVPKAKKKKKKSRGKGTQAGDEIVLTGEANETETEDRVRFDIPAAVSQELTNSMEPTTSGQQQPQESADSAIPPHSATTPASMPQALLAPVQDENLKNMMMSWYYAGYYTGLHEGRQQAMSAERNES